MQCPLEWEALSWERDHLTVAAAAAVVVVVVAVGQRPSRRAILPRRAIEGSYRPNRIWRQNVEPEGGRR